jgi:secreted trypsin-like serine protease
LQSAPVERTLNIQHSTLQKQKEIPSMKPFSLGLTLVLLVIQAHASDYIVGGTPVPANNPIAKSTVALLMVGSAGDISLCTGSILREDMIVTAAHCVADSPSSVHIVFGTHLSKARLQSSVVASHFEANPQYDPNQTGVDQNDIGVVFFEGGLPRGFEAATVMSSQSELQKGETVEIAGFGITDAQTKANPGTLRQTSVQVLNPELGKSEVVLDQTEGHGACHGDSGGPAFLKKGSKLLLWGVTSRGYPNGSPDDCAHDVVYTKIDSQMEFIRSALAHAQSS